MNCWYRQQHGWMLDERKGQNESIYHTIPFIYSSRKCKLLWQEADQWWLGDGKEPEGGTTKEQEKTFRGDGFVRDLDCGDSFTGVYIYQILPVSTLKMYVAYCMSITYNRTGFKKRLIRVFCTPVSSDFKLLLYPASLPTANTRIFFRSLPWGCPNPHCSAKWVKVPRSPHLPPLLLLCPSPPSNL